MHHTGIHRKYRFKTKFTAGVFSTGLDLHIPSVAIGKCMKQSMQPSSRFDAHSREAVTSFNSSEV